MLRGVRADLEGVAMDLPEFIRMTTIINRLAKRALFAEKQMVALEGQCAEWRRIADELKAERNAERERHKQTASVLAQYAPKTVDVPRAHPVKVGEYVKNDNGDVCQVHEVYAEYLLNTGWTWAFENCTPCDPPTASHDTPAGKETAQAAAEPKPGDVVRLVREPTADTVGDTLRKSLEWPWKSLWGSVGDRGKVVESVGKLPGARSVRIMNTGCTVWWPLSCMEVVKGADK